MSYSRRHIDIQFQLGKGSFGEGGYDTVKISGLRTSLTITKPGGVSLPSLEMQIFGMTTSLMNKLATLGKPIASVRDNVITVSAGSDDDQMSIIFSGTIMNAWADMRDVPNAVFVVSAISGLLQALKPVTPASYKGSADVAVILKALADQMGYAFENNGVSVQLANPYFPGTAIMQAQSAARAAHINMIIDDGTLAIWPMNGSRGGAVPKISKDTGLVGYPAHTQNGIALTTLYMPSIVYGSQVEVQSQITPAVGKWTVFSVSHELASETVDGPWFTHLECVQNGQPTPVA